MTAMAIGYERSSHDDIERRALSIEGQRIAIEAYAAANGFELTSFFSDEGMVSASTDLPGLEEALAKIGDEVIAAFIVFDIGRTGRDHRRVVGTMQVLADNGTLLHAVVEGRITHFGYTPLDPSYEEDMDAGEPAESAA